MKIKEVWEQYKKDGGRVAVLIFSLIFTLGVFFFATTGWIFWGVIFPLWVVTNGACWYEAWKDLKKNKKLRDQGYNV